MHNEDEIIISGAPVDVLSDNYEEFDQKFDQELDPAKFGEKLVQENSLKGTSREYQVYDSSHLLLSLVEKKKSPPKKYRVNLTYLSPEPEHYKLVVWNWLYGALASAALMALFIMLAVYELLALEFGLIGGAVTLTMVVICILIFVYLLRDEYIFKSEFGHVDLFFMENKRPDQATFDGFFIRLQQAIDNQHSKTSVADRLIDELKMCRRLKDEGIIDEDAYTSARTTIFKHKQYKT